MSKIEKIFYVYIPIVISVFGAFLIAYDNTVIANATFNLRGFLWLSISWISVFLFTGFFIRRLRYVKYLAFLSEKERVVCTMPYVLVLVYFISLFIIPGRGFSEITDTLIPYYFFFDFSIGLSVAYILLMAVNTISGIVLLIKMILNKVFSVKKIAWVIVSISFSVISILAFLYFLNSIISIV